MSPTRKDDFYVVFRWSSVDLRNIFLSVWPSHRYHTRPLLSILRHPPAVHPFAAHDTSSHPLSTLLLPPRPLSHSLLARGVAEQRALHLPPTRLPLTPSYSSLHLPLTCHPLSLHRHSTSPHSSHLVILVSLCCIRCCPSPSLPLSRIDVIPFHQLPLFHERRLW
jgi:hypothetical protein